MSAVSYLLSNQITTTTIFWLLFLSATNGTANHLLKLGSKRRRKKEELQTERDELLLFNEMEEEYKSKVKNLQS